MKVKVQVDHVQKKKSFNELEAKSLKKTIKLSKTDILSGTMARSLSEDDFEFRIYEENAIGSLKSCQKPAPVIPLFFFFLIL